MDIVETLRAESLVISAAPWSFGIALLAAIAGVWVIMRWRYAETIEKLKERLTDRDERIQALERAQKQEPSKAITFIGGEAPAPVAPSSPSPRPPVSKGGELKPDTPFSEAFMYSITGKWGQGFHSVPTTSDEHQAVLKAFYQIAYDGRVRVWGHTASAPDIVKMIPRMAWEANRINPLTLIGVNVRTEMDSKRPEAGFHGLQVCRWQWEEAGPPPLRTA